LNVSRKKLLSKVYSYLQDELKTLKLTFHDELQEKKGPEPQRVINKKSEKMAKAYYESFQSSMVNEKGEKISHIDLLLKKGKDYGQRLTELSEGNSKMELDGCTFQPQILHSYHSSQRDQNIHQHLFSIAKQRGSPKSKVDIEFDKEKEQCTFQPNKDRVGSVLTKGKGHERRLSQKSRPHEHTTFRRLS